ncbi:hypothetical protein P43SY_006202 [Pythium insidiosum]|uniref:TLDc domain-containing protein n=2 Tax=Pythium insidiosum TaxID=114742 RepID=A0AAD5QAE4_PYTIN|nr:hypothetical protein P43SY_006202 [Pythium insidiosum]
MGTTHSHHHHGHHESEWKGPFSDEEYDCLVKSYSDVVAAKDGASPQERLQRFFSLPIAVEVPSEWQQGLAMLGASFVELCKHTQEQQGEPSASAALTLNDFVRGIAQCTRASSQAILRALFRLFASDKNGVYLSEDEVHTMLYACLVMANDRLAENEPKQLVQMTRKLADAALPVPLPVGSAATTRQLSMDDLMRWTGNQVPLLYSTFSSWVTKRCFGRLARLSYNPPELSHPSDILSLSQFTALSLTGTPLQQRVDRLYTNAQDGLSFNRLCHHILGYGGPTLVVVRSTDGDVFGLYGDTEWRETSKFYGSNGCFLFRVEPHLSVYRVSASSANENYMYLNTKGVALPRGLGMGGDTTAFRLFLNEDFDENCYTSAKCLSFEPGRLTTKNNFAVDALEVWGCGGDDAIGRQRAYRKDTADMIDKMRKVDKAAFIGNEFDRNFLLSKTFGHGTDAARIADDEH